MPDAFCTIIRENKSQDKSCVIIWSFFRDPSKLPNYVLLRQGQPCQSTRQHLLPPSKTVHSRFNRSQKFSLRQSDNVAQTNKVCFFSRFNNNSAHIRHHLFFCCCFFFDWTKDENATDEFLLKTCKKRSSKRKRETWQTKSN